MDTDTMTLFRSGNSGVVRRVAETSPANLAVTVISVEEQLQGWYRRLHRDTGPGQLSETYRRLADTVRFYSGLNILNFSENAVARYDSLLSARLNVGKFDLRIAAIALEIDATVVTRNTRDFARVPGLAIEDWSV